MPNKFINLLIREKRFSLRFAIIIVIILSSVLIWRKQKIQIAQLKKVREEKQLIAQKSELEKQIQIYNDNLQRTKSPELKETKKMDLVLKGVFMQNNIYYALIGDTFYKEGDTCGNFTILKIDWDYVTIQDKDTRQTEILHFPE